MLNAIPSNKLRIGDKEISYKVNRNVGSNTLHLTLKPNLLLEISIPAGSKVDVNAILRKKRSWLERKVDEISGSKRIFDGEKVLYQGDYHRIAFVDSASRHVRIDNGKVILPSYANINLRQVLKDWMRQQTESFVEKRLAQFKKRFHLSAHGFSVRDTRKWAYCTRDKRIVFNSQLIALPNELADYVILHELAHLREFSHSKRFKYVLASVCPNFKERELGLKRFIADE